MSGATTIPQIGTTKDANLITMLLAAAAPKSNAFTGLFAKAIDKTSLSSVFPVPIEVSEGSKAAEGIDKSTASKSEGKREPHSKTGEKSSIKVRLVEVTPPLIQVEIQPVLPTLPQGTGFGVEDASAPEGKRSSEPFAPDMAANGVGVDKTNVMPAQSNAQQVEAQTESSALDILRVSPVHVLVEADAGTPSEPINDSVTERLKVADTQLRSIATTVSSLALEGAAERRESSAPAQTIDIRSVPLRSNGTAIAGDAAPALIDSDSKVQGILKSDGRVANKSLHEDLLAEVKSSVDAAFAAPTSSVIGSDRSHPDQPAPTTTTTVAAPVDRPAHSEAPENRAPVALHAMRMTEQMAGPELRFTWRSEHSGDIQLSTSLRQRDVQVTVRTEHLDTASAMRSELGSLDSRLHEHSLRLGEVNIVAYERSLSSSTGMSGQERGSREWNMPITKSETRDEQPQDTEDGVLIPNDDGRVSVLI